MYLKLTKRALGLSPLQNTLRFISDSGLFHVQRQGLSLTLLGRVSEEETEEDQYRNALDSINHEAIFEAVTQIYQFDTISEAYLHAVIDAILFIETSSDGRSIHSVGSAGSLQDYFSKNEQGK